MPAVTDHRGREREAPRISVNKLGEYLHASPGRRRTIIANQKKPIVAAVVRYVAAERAILDSIVRGNDPEPIERALAELRASTPLKPIERVGVNCCIDALTTYRTLDVARFLTGTVVQRPTGRARPLRMGGLDVSVRPELILTKEDAGERRVGLVKLHFPKSYALDEQAAESVCAISQLYAAEHLGGLGRVDRRLIVLIDVAAGRITVAPQASARVLVNARAACEEITARWGSIRSEQRS